MAAASTLRRAAAATAALLRPSATAALLRPSTTAAGAFLHPTRSLHAVARRCAPSMVGPGASFGQRRLLSGVVDKATSDKILKDIARIDAAGVQRHAASSKDISALAAKVIAYKEAVALKSYETTVEVGRTSFRVCILVLGAASLLGSTSLFIIYSARGSAVSKKAKALVKDKTEEINMRLQETLVKFITEKEQGDNAAMEPDIKARMAALDIWEEKLLAREEALKKREVLKNKGKEVGENKEAAEGSQRNGP